MTSSQSSWHCFHCGGGKHPEGYVAFGSQPLLPLLSPQHHSNMPFPTLISPDFHPPPFFTCHATLITKLNSSVVMIKIKVEEKYTTCPCQNSWQVVEPDSSIEEDRSSTGGVELFLLFPLLHLAGLYFQMYYP